MEAAPARTALLDVVPSVTTGGASIRFALHTTTRVSIDVFTAAGIRIRSVLDAELPGGVHDARWDGATTEGRRVPAGVYLVRFEAAGIRGTRRVFVLR